jgi:hypothetical protein
MAMSATQLAFAYSSIMTQETCKDNQSCENIAITCANGQPCETKKWNSTNSTQIIDNNNARSLALENDDFD